MVKLLKGTYKLEYRVWLIKFPYWSETFVHAGTKKDALTFARKYKKQHDIPYAPKIIEVL